MFAFLCRSISGFTSQLGGSNVPKHVHLQLQLLEPDLAHEQHSLQLRIYWCLAEGNSFRSFDLFELF